MNFDTAIALLTGIILESLPTGTDYLTVKADLTAKIRQDAQELRDKYEGKK